MKRYQVLGDVRARKWRENPVFNCGLWLEGVELMVRAVDVFRRVSEIHTQDFFRGLSHWNLGVR